MRNRPHRLGFTLIEALVAVALTGVGTAALINALGGMNRAEARALEAEKMQRLAENKLDELIGLQQFDSTGGDFSDDNEPNYQWEFSDETTDVTDLDQFTIVVSKSNDDTLKQTLSRLYYKPPAQGATGQ